MTHQEVKCTLIEQRQLVKAGSDGQAHELTVLPTGPYLRPRNSLRNGSAWGSPGPGADSVSSVNPEEECRRFILGTSAMESKIIWRTGIFLRLPVMATGYFVFSTLHITLKFRFAFAFIFV